MPVQKVKFTVWLDPAVLQAAKSRAGHTGASVSEVLADAARDALLGQRGDGGAGDIVKAVDRVFYQVQRAERRRAFDQDLLKEMLGLAVLSFFNHTPAVPESEKRAALVSGKTRFGRFLDTLANNLRAGRSVLRDLPGADGASQDAARPDAESGRGTTADTEDHALTPETVPPPPTEQPPGESGAADPLADRPRG
jgi:hypothetical protein